MADKPGVLGGLPRSRPGHRSARRQAAAGAGERPAKKPSQRSSATTGGGERRREATSPPHAATSSGASNERPARDGEDVLTGAARAAMSVGGAGLRVASRLAGGAIRRLPRP